MKVTLEKTYTAKARKNDVVKLYVTSKYTDDKFMHFDCTNDNTKFIVVVDVKESKGSCDCGFTYLLEHPDGTRKWFNIYTMSHFDMRVVLHSENTLESFTITREVFPKENVGDVYSKNCKQGVIQQIKPEITADKTRCDFRYLVEWQDKEREWVCGSQSWLTRG